MQTSERRKLSMCALGAWVLACGGFEPDFAPPPPPSASAGLAGWSYDAGLPPEMLAGRDATAHLPGSGGSAGRPPAHQEPNDPAAEGGHAGESDSGGSGSNFAAGSAGAGGAGTGGTGASHGGSTSRAGGAGQSGSGGGAGRAGANHGGVGAASGAGTGGAGGATAGGAAGEGESGAGGGAVLEHALLFSEYVEASSSFKALELRAERASSLDGCRVAIFSNGAATASTSLVLEGELAAGEVYVLCSKTLAEELIEVCDANAGNLNFNGDDAVVLECDGVPLDSIGQVGIDPGTAWQTDEASTADMTLVRRCGVLEGDPVLDDAFDPSVEWTALPNNTFSGLGDPTCG